MPVWKPNYKQPNENVQQKVPEIELPQLVVHQLEEEEVQMDITDGDGEGNENLSESSRLLGTERRAELKGSGKGTLGVAAAVSDTATTTATSTVASDAATVFGQQKQTETGVKMTHCKPDMATIVEGGIADTDLQLDSQKFPDDNKNNVQNMNANGVLLNATTTREIADLQYDATKCGRHTEMGVHVADEQSPRVWRKLVQKWPIISEQLALLVICGLLWAIGSILLPEHAQPHTAIIRISLLIVGAQITGVLVTFVHLPDMLGMLFFGVLYTNVGLADFSSIQPFEAFLREIALINIMLLVGIGLDAAAFAKLWLMIMRLTLIPTIAEVLIITVIAHFLLAMPWLWGILLGLVITAVSPNVIVSVLLELKEKRLGMNKGIHTLIYALTACNDVVAIFAFGVVQQIIFSQSNLQEKIIRGPVGIGIGLVYGYLFGLALQFMPSKNAYYVNGLRFVLTVLGGMIAVMGSRAIGYTSAGALGCVEVAFFARMGWKRDQEKQQKLKELQQQQLGPQANASNVPDEVRNEIDDNVANRLDLLWKFLKPVSFALIGKEINFAILDGRVVGFGILLVVIGSLFRLAFSYISTLGGNLSRSERAYITISGFPKATVQAALGPLALDMARSLAVDAEKLKLAGNVLIISVLAILLTAPLGAILMTRLAPRWLEHSVDLRRESGIHVMNGVSNTHQQENKSQNAVITTTHTDASLNV